MHGDETLNFRFTPMAIPPNLWIPGVLNNIGNSCGNYRLMKRWGSPYTVTVFILLFLIIFFSTIFIYWIDFSALTTNSLIKAHATKEPAKQHFPLKCSIGNSTSTCTAYPETFEPTEKSDTACPEYFRWIYEDLKPWKSTGITKDMVNRGRTLAHFRLVFVKGKLYIESYEKPFQTRDVFTIWGFVQLLRMYPGKVPDLELVFWCEDKPIVKKEEFEGPDALAPPPVFHYCGHEGTFDIVFPDWTFWGWAETSINPWVNTLNSLKEGNKKVKWTDRIPYAHWKGNPKVSSVRGKLGECNVSHKYDWNARLYSLDWGHESEKGYQDTKLEDQCTHRYKVYVEGNAWSVSQKYILACDSMTLVIKPEYYDFFFRGMVPLQHYWPIRPQKMCEDIKFAVDWGQSHAEKAQKIGRRGSDFILEDVKMKYVYDYMFHLLIEYAKLLKFEPSAEGAVEVCSESTACPLDGLWKHYLEESIVIAPSDTLPCTIPPPYDPQTIAQLLHKKETVQGKVDKWGNEYWRTLNKTQ